MIESVDIQCVDVVFSKLCKGMLRNWDKSVKMIEKSMDLEI